jgi:hypothetical protein
MLQTIRRPPRTAQDIALGARLAKMQNREIGPGDVARVLDDAKAKYVLVGAHAANGYIGRPRHTLDVDVVVEHPKKAATAISRAFSHLTMRDTPLVIRFYLPDGDEAIDLMKPQGSPLWKRLHKIAKTVEVDGEPLRIPPLEGVLAAKFAAMASPFRRATDKAQDGLDFAKIIEVNKRVNLTLLKELGELIYSGGGEAIVQLAKDARAGKILQF